MQWLSKDDYGTRFAPVACTPMHIVGKDACNIVQSANTKCLFEKVAPAKNMFRYQQDRWLALKDGTQEIEDTLQRTLALMGKTPTKHRRWSARHTKPVHWIASDDPLNRRFVRFAGAASSIR